MDNRPIGIFDSGLGGLTVVKECMDILPNENIMYFGDVARIPYGTRSEETVRRYSLQCTRFLLSKNIKMLIIGCNTASARSLEIIRNTVDIPVIGVIRPGARAAVRATRNSKIGVIGTISTIGSGAYEKEIKNISPEADVVSGACSLFVPIVEEGWADTEVARAATDKYLAPIKAHGIDTLILGCTHYPLLRKTITGYMGEGVTLVNPAYETVMEAKALLEQKDMLAKGGNNPHYEYYTSDFSPKFVQICSEFLHSDIQFCEKVDIEKY